MIETRSSPRRGVLEILAAAVLFGTTGTTASFAPAAATPVSIGSARLVIGGLGMLATLPWLGGRRGTAIALWRNPWAFAAGLMVAAYQLAFFAGVSLAGVALATLVTIGSGPILVGLLSWVLLRERPTTAWWASTMLCITGLILLTLDGTVQPGVDLAGLALALVAGACYAAYTVAAKRLMHAGTAPTVAMASIFSFGGLLLLPVLLATGPAWLASLDGLTVALWLGLGTTTLAYLLFGRGLQVLPAGPAATLVLAEPLVATILGVGLLGERLGPIGWIGAALVAGGLALQGLTSSRARRGDETNVVEGALP
jgi:DME family drug/metabolite transporter